MNFPKEDDVEYQTVAGLVLEDLKHIPDLGESFVKNGWRFEVIDLDGRRVDKVLVSASTLEADVRKDLKSGGNKAAAAVIGKRIAERAKAAGIEAVAFDRAGFRFHGRVKALADAAREGGLKF